MESQDFFLADRDYYNYLAFITEHEYLFANGAVRKMEQQDRAGNLSIDAGSGR